MRTSTFDLHAKAADVDLWKLLHDWRTQAPPVPYDEIAVRLREHDIRVSRHTVWRWVQERNIDTARPYAPRRRVQESSGGESTDQVAADSGTVVRCSETVPPAADEQSPPVSASPESAYERELRRAREAM